MSQWAKATNEIVGLVRGLLADGEVNEKEVTYLRDWINSRPDVLNDKLVLSLAARIQRVLTDGIVTLEELAEVKSLLTEYAGEGQQPTTLPLDNPMPDIQFREKCFCFTGAFVSGKRSWCHEQTEQRGGLAVDDVNYDLHYLVIGSKVSAAWVNQTYGRKIEAAVGIREKSRALAIVNEDHWLGFFSK